MRLCKQIKRIALRGWCVPLRWDLLSACICLWKALKAACLSRHADEEDEGSDKKSKRARKEKERERRRSGPAAEEGAAGTPRRDGAEPMDVDAAQEAPSSGGKSDGEL